VPKVTVLHQVDRICLDYLQTKTLVDPIWEVERCAARGSNHNYKKLVPFAGSSALSTLKPIKRQNTKQLRFRSLITCVRALPLHRPCGVTRAQL
jgi:hypothetical protein